MSGFPLLLKELRLGPRNALLLPVLTAGCQMVILLWYRKVAEPGGE